MKAKAIGRIAVQATLSDKNAITAKAKKFGMPVSELMLRAAFAYESDQALNALADAAKGAADCAGSAIDDAMTFIVVSNKRITSMECRAALSALPARSP